MTRRTLQWLHQQRAVHSSAPVRLESVSMVDEKEWLEGEGRAEAREHALRKRHQQAAAQKAAAANDVGVGQSPQPPSACVVAKPDDHQATEPRSLVLIVVTSCAFLCLPFLALTMRNTQRSVPLNLPLLRSRAAFVLQALRLDSYALDVWVTTDATLRRLNRQYRLMDKPTDILSFPFQPLTPPAADVSPEQRALPPVEQGVSELGQIVISAPYVLRDSAKMGQTVDQRLRTLIVHGVCHLLGYVRCRATSKTDVACTPCPHHLIVELIPADLCTSPLTLSAFILAATITRMRAMPS
jgi:rRNA maturation RNase YbeY